MLSSGPRSGSQDPDLLLLLFPAEDAQLKCPCVTNATDSTSVLDVGAVDATWEKIAEYISEYSLAGRYLGPVSSTEGILVGRLGCDLFDLKI